MLLVHRDSSCPQPPQQEEQTDDHHHQQKQHLICVDAVSLEQQQQQQHHHQRQQQEKEGAGEDAASLLLLPKQAALAVMHWAAAQSKTRLGSDTVVATGMNLAGHMLLLTQQLGTAVTARMLEPLELAVPDSLQQQQQRNGGHAMSRQNNSHHASFEGGTALQGWWLAGEDLDLALALVTKLTGKLSRLPAADAAVVATGPLASVSESSSSGGSSSSGANGISSTVLLAKGAAPGEYEPIMFATAMVVMQLQAHVAAMHSAELLATGTDHSQHSTAQHGTAQLSTGSSSWSRHLLPLLRITKATVRSVTSCGLPQHAYMLTRPLCADDPYGLAAAYRDDPALGPDSPVALSLFSTCCSLLKVLVNNGSVAAADTCTPGTARARLQLLQSVLSLCDISFGEVSRSVPLVAEAASPKTWVSNDDGSRPDLGSHEASSSHRRRRRSSSTAMLPWLVLLGRCCLEVVREVQPYAACSVEALPACQVVLIKNISASVVVCSEWLHNGSNKAQLAAAGFRPSELHPAGPSASASAPLAAAAQQQQQQQQAALPPGTTAAAVADTQAAPSLSAAVAAWAQSLQKLGLSGNTLAISCACNNPYCSSTEGLSELQLVEGRARLCAKCRVARYCSRDCQAQHWKLHKSACKELEAARQAQGNAGPPAAAVGCLE